MNVLITDSGFAQDDWTQGFSDDITQTGPDGPALDLASDTDPTGLKGRLEGIPLIRVAFPSFADGRGFTIAAQLRLIGYKGRLRAMGHVLADQYAMARRCGFDEVEISEALASRQPEESWIFRADWPAHDYQSRLRG